MNVERGAHRHLMIIGQQPTGMAIRMITVVSKNAYKMKHERTAKFENFIQSESNILLVILFCKKAIKLFSSLVDSNECNKQRSDSEY